MRIKGEKYRLIKHNGMIKFIKYIPHVAMLSGGQDSTAMTLRLLELGYPVDYIVFADTTLEFDEMYEYIDKLDAFFQRKYGISITRLKPNKDFINFATGLNTKGENIGKVRGTPRSGEMCHWRKESKQYPTERWMKKNGIFKKHIQYIGYVYGESERLFNAPENVRAPLIRWKWTEAEVQKYLKENMMENKLYQHFIRTGCSCCPKHRLQDSYMVYKYYPEKWDFMKKIEDQIRIKRVETNEEHYPAWHIKYFVSDMEKIFDKKDKQQTFEFEFEPVQDCFCKI